MGNSLPARMFLDWSDEKAFAGFCVPQARKGAPGNTVRRQGPHSKWPLRPAKGKRRRPCANEDRQGARKGGTASALPLVKCLLQSRHFSLAALQGKTTSRPSTGSAVPGHLSFGNNRLFADGLFRRAESGDSPPPPRPLLPVRRVRPVPQGRRGRLPAPRA